MNFLKILPLLAILGVPIVARAHDDCQRHLLTMPGDIRITNSGQDVDLQPELREAARIIYHEIAPKLGLVVPQMSIRSLSATDMAALSSSAGHPAPHWYDGAKVVSGAKQAAGILEFVVPGQPVHHQFVRDTNSLHETLIVYAHVAGHYDFGATSTYFTARDPDQVRYSYELATLMTRLQAEEDKAAVSEFYHRLLSLQYAQDMSRGSYDPAEDFAPKPADRKGRRFGDKVIYPNATHPSHPTESMLQAFVKNLPATSEPWKREMAEAFEKLHRATPAYVQTKIMNEGWATIMEYIVLAHSPWHSSADAVTFGQINSGVTRPSLSNPYWLGSQAWLRIRDRFLKRPEIAKLSPIDQDRAFIDEAHKIIRQYNDYTFLLMALDEPWVVKHNLLLNRRRDGQHRLAISRDPKRVVQWIAHKIANRDLSFPKIELVNFNATEDGAVLLRHNPVLGTPLVLDSMAKTLYVLSRLIERPVTIQTIGSPFWTSSRPASIEPFPLKVTVHPKGLAKVETPTLTNEIDGVLTKRLQGEVDAFRQDESISYTFERASADQKRFSMEMAGGLPPVAPLVASVMGHAPTAAQAVWEYQNLTEIRLKQSLLLAVQGKWPIKILGDGKKVRIRILPEIPNFELDRSHLNRRKAYLTPTPPDARIQVFGAQLSDLLSAFSGGRAPAPLTGPIVSSEPEMPDEDLDLGEGPYQPGDVWKDPEDKKGGGGDGEPQEGEADEPGDGGAGEGGGGDPSYIDIPIEMYGAVLAEQIELRNLRRTKGSNELTETIRIGGEHNPSGSVLWDRTAQEALGLGMAIARKQGKNPAKLSQRKLLEIGMKYLSPADQVVASRDDEKIPDFDAVMLYIADTSGSMTAEHQKVQRQMIANERALLKTLYPKLKEHFIIYDTTAREVSEKDFFSRQMGGGTNAVEAFKLAQKLLEEKYPRNRYNRFSQIFSDGDDFSSGESSKEGETLAEMCEFLSYGHVEPNGDHNNPNMNAPLSQEFLKMSEENKEKVGFAALTKDHASLLEALKKYFGKRK